ncbi:MAG: PEP-CTERM sorting domain-containing protein [Tepidisphaeraceae bacterium]
MRQSNSALRGLASVAAIACMIATSRVQGAITYWTGAAGTDFATSGNWSNGVPTSNDYSDTARFYATYPPSSTAPANKNPTLAAARLLNAAVFDSAGWTIDGSRLTLRTINSAGIGTNTFNDNIKTGQYGFQWSATPGNTLSLAGGLLADQNSALRFVGGGTLDIAAPIVLAYTGVTTSLLVDTGVVKIHGTTPYASGSNATHIATVNGILQLQTTTSAAQSLISSGRIVDDTGMGLQVSDIGGGFVAISVPEPATLGVAALAVGALLRRRRA